MPFSIKTACRRASRRPRGAAELAHLVRGDERRGARAKVGDVEEHVLALLITRDTLNIMSLIGVILLMGIVAKNAILLIDFAIESVADSDE